MNQKKFEPKIANVKFNPGVSALSLEKVVSEYQLTKTFPELEFNSNSQRARLYVLDVSQGNEVINKLKEKYGNLIEYVELPSLRRPR